MTIVLVTGASGFIAKHIVRELLESNYTVRASVRSRKGRDQLKTLFPDAGLSFVTLDLLQDEGWREALEGVDVMMHTTSPFPATTPKDPEELIRPAVDGTLRALRAAQASGVGRVILTSSCAAIYKDAAKSKMGESTRENWTDPSSPDTSAYESSKTLAEQAAWDFAVRYP
jgi:dihydroflavonol-4-reductase